MHVPYIPFDSNAPAVFERHGIDNYIKLAVVTLVFYDHLITFSMEVERIWTLKWGLPKFLFLVSRYVIPPMLMIGIIGNIGYPLILSFCTFEVHYGIVIRFMSLIVAELILLIRVSAIYGHNRIILSFLTCLFLGHLAGVIIVVIFSEKIFDTAIYYEFLPGCWTFVNGSPSGARWNSSWPIPFICLEATLLILTLAKAFSYWNYSYITIKLLARDSIIFFAIMFVCLLENIIVVSGGRWLIVLIPTEWIACMAVSRMMLNIRGLTFNDPLDTQGLQLTSLLFKHQESGDVSQVATAEQYPANRV